LSVVGCQLLVVGCWLLVGAGLKSAPTVAGFRTVRFRGDTDFSQTQHFDRWDAAGVQFVFGIDAIPNLVTIAENLAESEWDQLERPAKYTVQTIPRGKRENVKERIVVECHCS
jgi:hypothetical protein